MPTHLLQLADQSNPPSVALVEVSISAWTKTMTWKCKTPGAFHVLPAEEHSALNFLNPSGTDDGPVFYAVYPEESFNCFQLFNFFVGPTLYTNNSGEGRIYPEGAQVLRPGGMSWKKL